MPSDPQSGEPVVQRMVPFGVVEVLLGLAALIAVADNQS